MYATSKLKVIIAVIGKIVVKNKFSRIINSLLTSKSNKTIIPISNSKKIEGII